MFHHLFADVLLYAPAEVSKSHQKVLSALLPEVTLHLKLDKCSRPALHAEVHAAHHKAASYLPVEHWRDAYHVQWCTESRGASFQLCLAQSFLQKSSQLSGPCLPICLRSLHSFFSGQYTAGT